MKRRSNLMIIILLLSILNLKAQTIDELSSVVAFLSNPISKNKFKYGTGFFVKSEKSLYLITAEHISKFLTVNSDITIKQEGDRPFTLKFSELMSSKKPLSWKYHNEGDISLLILNPNKKILKKLEKHFLPLSSISSNRKSISREILITILGFPLALGTKNFFSPISLETKAASGFLTLNRSDNKKPAIFFITQNPSISGYSGAPVFDTGLTIQSQSRITLRKMQSKVKLDILPDST